jgi:hypothetical protein
MTIEYQDFDVMYRDLNKAGYKMRDLHGWLNVERKNGGVHENNYLAIGFSYESRNWHWEILPRDPNGEESMRILEEVIAERMAEGLPKPVPENAFFEKV